MMPSQIRPFSEGLGAERICSQEILPPGRRRAELAFEDVLIERRLTRGFQIAFEIILMYRGNQERRITCQGFSGYPY